MATYTCPTHHTDQHSFCIGCVNDFANRRDADTMSGDERAAEMDRWVRVLTIPFSDVHQRIEELVGRGVFTHEMAGEALFAELKEEARTRQTISLGEQLSKLPWDKQALLLTEDGPVSLP
jgi:hypothetical protein